MVTVNSLSWLLNKQEVNMLDYNYWAIAQYRKDLIVDELIDRSLGFDLDDIWMVLIQNSKLLNHKYELDFLFSKSIFKIRKAICTVFAQNNIG